MGTSLVHLKFQTHPVYFTPAKASPVVEKIIALPSTIFYAHLLFQVIVMQFLKLCVYNMLMPFVYYSFSSIFLIISLL